MAWPSVQRSDADWSMPPVGARAMVFSALAQIAASEVRDASSCASARPDRSDSATATAHSSAAELDSPAPSGTRPSTARSAPATWWPACSRAQKTPAT